VIKLKKQKYRKATIKIIDSVIYAQHKNKSSLLLQPSDYCNLITQINNYSKLIELNQNSDSSSQARIFAETGVRNIAIEYYVSSDPCRVGVAINKTRLWISINYDLKENEATVDVIS
jgi:hypothetical protein